MPSSVSKTPPYMDWQISLGVKIEHFSKKEQRLSPSALFDTSITFATLLPHNFTPLRGFILKTARKPQSFRTAIDSFHILSVHLPYFLRTKGRITVHKSSRLLTLSTSLPPFCHRFSVLLPPPFPPFFHTQALPHVLLFHTFSIRFPFFFRTFASLFFYSNNTTPAWYSTALSPFISAWEDCPHSHRISNYLPVACQQVSIKNHL